MKYFAIVMLTVLLASCSLQSEDKKDTVKDEPQNSTVDTELESMMNNTIKEMENGMDEMKDSEMDESKIEILSYTYANDAQEVNMDIAYELDTEGKISSISILSDNYDLSAFNTGSQKVLIGKTLTEASNIDTISGSSLTTEAFKEAIKSKIK